MTMAVDLARFAVRASWDDLSPDAQEAIRVRILDALGCALGALHGPPVRAIGSLVHELGGRPRVTLIGGGRSAPDRAALYNGALVRYLDFNDSFLAAGETCHPSDALGALLAAAEYAGVSGRDLATALAVSYQVQCRLGEVAPVRARGFDHVTHLSVAAAAGSARALGLDVDRAANAVAIAVTANNALRVTRTGELSHWKGLAAPNTAAAALHATLLAAHGVSGPPEAFEGNKGFMHTVSGPFEIDWGAENLEMVGRTILKRFNAEVHSQSAIEAVVELRAEHALAGADIESIEADVFDVAFDIIGGGEEGDKVAHITTKEQADHSLQYMIAVAALDGAVTPAQYEAARIRSEDVQSLMRRVRVRPRADLSARFPGEHACEVRIRLRDGRVVERAKRDYEGFHTRPMPWQTVVDKLDRLAAPHTDAARRARIVDAVAGIDRIGVDELTGLLAQAGRSQEVA